MIADSQKIKNGKSKSQGKTHKKTSKSKKKESKNKEIPISPGAQKKITSATTLGESSKQMNTTSRSKSRKKKSGVKHNAESVHDKSKDKL